MAIPRLRACGAPLGMTSCATCASGGRADVSRENSIGDPMLATLVRTGVTVTLLTVAASSACAQTVVTGIVRDDRNAPLSGAGISARDARVSVMTSDAGRYRLVIPPSGADSDSVTVVARRIGFDPVSKRVAVGGNVTVD